MPAEWHDPITWDVDQLVTNEDLNEQVRDNLEWLFSPNKDEITLDEANITTTNTSWEDVDAGGDPDLSLSVETYGEDVVVHFHGMVVLSNSNAGGNPSVCFNVAVDGTNIAADDGIIGFKVNNITGGTYVPISFSRRITGLSAATHTFALRWKLTVDTGTVSATLYAGAGTSGGRDQHPQMWVTKG